MYLNRKIKYSSLVAAFAAIVLAATSAYGGNYGNKAKSDIVDTAVAAGDFTTLAAALQAGGLIDRRRFRQASGRNGRVAPEA